MELAGVISSLNCGYLCADRFWDADNRAVYCMGGFGLAVFAFGLHLSSVGQSSKNTQ
jgi:hypothetical protein